jgi:hypothetical protein
MISADDGFAINFSAMDHRRSAQWSPRDEGGDSSMKVDDDLPPVQDRRDLPMMELR